MKTSQEMEKEMNEIINKLLRKNQHYVDDFFVSQYVVPTKENRDLLERKKDIALLFKNSIQSLYEHICDLDRRLKRHEDEVKLRDT